MLIEFTTAEISAYYAARVPHLKRRAAQWRGPCPIHHGRNDSFAVDAASGRWFCHSKCGRGGDILDLEEALTGGDFTTRKAEVFRLMGRIEPGYRRDSANRSGNSADTAHAMSTRATGRWCEVDRYPYPDRDGSPLFSYIRFIKPDGKKILIPVRPSGIKAAGTIDPKRPDGVQVGGLVVGLNAGEFLLDRKLKRTFGKPTWRRKKDEDDSGYSEAIYRFGDCPRVPYRLPKLLNAETVYLVEGEKDVHTLEEWGLVASCNPGGSGNSKLYTGWEDHFRGRHIIIIPDNDEPGRKHAATVARILLRVAAPLRIVELPGVPEKGDVTDWRDAGGTLERLRELTEAAAPIDAVWLSELLSRWGLAGEEPRQQVRAQAGSLVTRRLSDISAKPVSWLWPGRIARGKLTIIAGNPGLGKSQLTASIAAIVTTGGRWPVDRSQSPTGDVLFLSAEDDPADTLRPRLEAAGADLHRVHVMDSVIRGYTGEGEQRSGAFTLQCDLEALSAKLNELGDVAAVFIDPITAYLGDVDSHRNAEIRAVLAPVSELAAKHNTAIIGVSHLNKSGGTADALMRVSGSLAFVAAARAAYLVAQDPETPRRRFFLPMKNNVGPDLPGLAFCIEATNIPSAAGLLGTSLVVWDSEPVTTTADEVMHTEAPERGSALREAEDWLRETLSQPTPATEIYRRAKEADISCKTVRRASESLKIVKTKTGMREGWVWSMPPKTPETSEDAQKNCVGTFETNGHLRDPNEAIVEVEL